MRPLYACAFLALTAAKKPEPPPEVPPIEGIRVEAIRFVVHARAVEVIEEISVPAASLEREVFVSFPLVELPSAVEVSLLDTAGNEACTDLPWRRLPQKVRTTALLHGAAHETGMAFALRACAALEPGARVTVRMREAFVRSVDTNTFEWRRSLGQASIEPSPLRHLVAVRGGGGPELSAAEARFCRSAQQVDARPPLFVEGEMQNAEPTAADPALVHRTGADRLLVRLRFTP
jgi:hypothetical protein